MPSISLTQLSLDCWIEICSFLSSKKEQLPFFHCCKFIYETIEQNETYFFTTLCSAIGHQPKLISSMSPREYYFRFPIFESNFKNPFVMLECKENGVSLQDSWTNWMQQTKLLQKKNIQFITFLDFDASYSALQLANTFIGVENALHCNSTLPQLVQFSLPIQHFIYHKNKKQSLQQLLILYPHHFHLLSNDLKMHWMHLLLSISTTLVVCSKEEEKGNVWKKLDECIGCRLELFPLPKYLRSVVCFTSVSSTDSQQQLKLYNPFPEISNALLQEYDSKLLLSSFFMSCINFFGKLYGIHYSKDIPRDQLWNLLHQCLQEGAHCILPWIFQETSILNTALDGTFFSQFISEQVSTMNQIPRVIDPIVSMETFIPNYITKVLIQDYCNYYQTCLQSEFFIPNVSKSVIQSNGVLDMKEFMEQNQIHEEATLKLFNQSISPLLANQFESVLKDKLKTVFLKLYKENQHGSKVLCDQLFKNSFGWKSELIQVICLPENQSKEMVLKMERKLNEGVFDYLGKAKGIRKYLVLYALASDLVSTCLEHIPSNDTLWSAMLLKFKTLIEKIYLTEMHNMDAVRSLLQNQIALQKKMICMQNSIDRVMHLKNLMQTELEIIETDNRYLNRKNKWNQFYKNCGENLNLESFENLERVSKQFFERQIKELDATLKQSYAELAIYQQKYRQIKTVL